MTGPLNKFDFREEWPSGLAMFTTSDPFMPHVASEAEIDWQVEALKTDLDRVARRMKVALRRRPANLFQADA